jgi:hypothetical protein
LPMAPKGLKEMLSFRLADLSSLPGDPDTVFCLTRLSPKKKKNHTEKVSKN